MGAPWRLVFIVIASYLSSVVLAEKTSLVAWKADTGYQFALRRLVRENRMASDMRSSTVYIAVLGWVWQAVGDQAARLC
jgi:hypothetical protein